MKRLLTCAGVLGVAAGLLSCGGDPTTAAGGGGATSGTGASAGSSGGGAAPGGGGAGGSSTGGSGAATTGGSGGAPTGGSGGSGPGGGGAAGGSGGAGGGGGSPPVLFDMPMIQDPATAECAFDNLHSVPKNGVTLDVWNVHYVSWESIGGELQPILIRGFAAKPAGQASGLPGVVSAHGLGGFSTEDQATGLASLLGMFVIAYTGPGGGDSPENTSEGLPSGYDGGYRMFDTIPDTRGSWFWGHAVAGMRGLTCLSTRPEVDATRLGMTGFSAGGVATLIAAGVDDRVKAAVPLSGTHAWSVAVQAPEAWQHALLAAAGLDDQSPEWVKLQDDIIAPAATVAKTQGKVLMVNGSTDEFFPLTAHTATFEALPGTDKRTSIAGNFDHGCYLVSGVESAQTIEDRAALRAEGGQRMWFSHWFGTGSSYAYLPEAPVAQMMAVGQLTYAAAVVDSGGPDLEVEEVKVWWSNDDSFVYGNVVLDPQGNGVYSKLVAFTLLPGTITFVDVQYKTKSFLSPERFSLSSPPSIPAGLVPHIRDIQSCL